MVTAIRQASSSPGKIEDFMATSMRSIRNLQKQLRDIGERYQNELAHPTTAGPEEQEILMEFARQMSSVQREIDALQQSIMEHQTVEQLKKDNYTHLKISSEDGNTLSTENSDRRDSVTKKPQQSGRVAKREDAVQSESMPSVKEINPTSTAGSVINTYA